MELSKRGHGGDGRYKKHLAAAPFPVSRASWATNIYLISPYIGAMLTFDGGGKGMNFSVVH